MASGLSLAFMSNSETLQLWLIDYRIFAPAEDGKTKLDVAKEMFDLAVHRKQFQFGQLSDYLIGQLKSPSVKMALAYVLT